MSILLDRQLLLGDLLPKLYVYIQVELGCRIKPGECSRAPAQAWLNATTPAQRDVLSSALDHLGFDEFQDILRSIKGTPGILLSNHVVNLAHDIDIFRRDGTWLNRGGEPEWDLAGSYWKALNPLCCWGGDFTSRPDARHFSILHPDGVHK